MSYIKIEDRPICFFDIDETLISHFPIEGVEPFLIVYNKVARDLWPMKANIDLISELRLCGYNIAAWSQSGSDHTERIIKELKIEHLIDLIVPKPKLYVDDKEFSAQSIPRVYKK